MGHVVRKAWSRRCSRNLHGHSYLVEFILGGEDSNLDQGQMLVDFGIFKKMVHPFVDSFDHSFWIWDIPEDKHVTQFLKDNFERVLVSPWSTSAESQACMFHVFFETIVAAFNTYEEVVGKPVYNGIKGELYTVGVTVHETATGYATAEMPEFKDYSLDKLWISDGIKEEWPAGYGTFYDNVVKLSAIITKYNNPWFDKSLLKGDDKENHVQLVKAIVDYCNK